MNEVILDSSNIEYYLSKGIDHKLWYTREPEALIELLPEFDGLPVIRTFAVTSMTTSIEANVHLALKALKQMKNGDEFTGFLPVQIIYLDLIRAGQNVPGRKIRNFINALEGDVNAIVCDLWMCKAFGILKKRKFKNREYFLSSKKAEYDAIEQYCIENALKINLEPRQYCSMIWAGVKREFSQSRNVSWSDILIQKKGLFDYL